MENKDDHPHGNGNGIHHDENIVIVGGGIGGLACAVALHKVGLKAVVLEQANTLRSGGISITLWANAFRVLDVLGVGEKFRTMYTNIQEYPPPQSPTLSFDNSLPHVKLFPGKTCSNMKKLL